MRSIALLAQDKVIHHWRDFTEGRIAKTMECTIVWPDGKQRRSVLKAFTTATSQGLLNEIIGYLLARYCGLPVSPRAALVGIPKNINPPEDVVPFGFAVDVLPGQTPGSLHQAGKARECARLLRLLREWSNAPAAVAFDDWVANADRNAGNLLVAGEDEVYLIDHTHLPITMNWQQSDLDPHVVVENQLARMLRWNDQSTLPIKSSIARSTDSHYDSLQKAEQELSYWLEQLVDDSETRQALLTFFRERARSGRARISTMLKLIA